MSKQRKMRRGWIQYVLMTRKVHNKQWGIHEIIRRVRLDEECQQILQGVYVTE